MTRSGRALLPVMAGLGLLVVGAGACVIWQLQTQRDRTIHQLQQARTAIAQDQEQLTMLETERTRLAEDYETIKTRWTQSEEQMRRMTDAADRMTAELSQLARERADLQRQFEEAKTNAGQLQHQVGELEQTSAALTKDKASLTSSVEELVGRAKAQRQEIDQMKASLEEQRAQALQLGDQLAQVSREYEQLAQTGPHAAVVPGVPHPERPHIEWRLSLDRAPEEESAPAQPQPRVTARLIGAPPPVAPQSLTAHVSPQQDVIIHLATYSDRLRPRRERPLPRSSLGLLLDWLAGP